MAVPKQIAAVMMAVALLAGCATTQRTDLYFGRNIPGGGQVTEQQWKAFSDSILTPAFSGGYTETDAQGKWLDPGIGKTITEDTKVVTVIGKRSAKRNKQLNRVTEAYINRFNQQAVLRVDGKVRQWFIMKKAIN